MSFWSKIVRLIKKRDVDYVISLMDWEKNIDPNYRKTYFRPPVLIHSDGQYTEKWITYANEYIAAKELTVYPGQTVVIRDKAAYGCIFVQGHGSFGVYDAETPVMLRYGQASADEYFISEQAAREGVKITNNSKFDPIVILKHFGPNNPDTPKSVK